MIPVVDGVPTPEQCPYAIDTWGSLLYEHSHPYGSACDGCQHNRVAPPNNIKNGMNYNTCAIDVIHPTGDSNPCPYREGKLSPPKATVGLACSSTLAQIIMAGINDRDFTYWQTTYTTYSCYATLGWEPVTYGACKGFILEYVPDEGCRVRIGDINFNKGRVYTAASVTGIVRAKIDNDLLHLYTAKPSIRDTRVTIIIDDALQSQEECEDETCDECVEPIPTKPAKCSLEAWL